MPIPPKIHYCWFGGNPLPELAKKCIDSWKKYFPEYEIIEWNETNYDVNIIPYSAEAYHAKKYAFVSDYARFWILYNYGGVYFDTDVEVIKRMDDIITKGAFMGCENDLEDERSAESGVGVNPGLGIAAEPGHAFYKEVLDYYSKISFYNEDGSYNKTTVVQHVTRLLEHHGLTNSSAPTLCAGIAIYPKEYFCPMNYETGQLHITNNTCSIHHYMASWITKGQKIYIILQRIIGKKTAGLLVNFLKKHGLVK